MKKIACALLLLLALPAWAVDTDTDGIDEIIDNCAQIANADQLNTDGDDAGDACDAQPLVYSGPLQVAAGAAHTCVLTSAGGVKCWGQNWGGQLGDGSSTSHSTAWNVSGLASGVTKIVAGSSHTCALTNTYGVKCWGDNSQAELGDGTRVSRYTPVDVVGLQSDILSIAAGGSHTCALTISGSVKCWGYSGQGQLGIGDGSTTYLTTPVDVAGLQSGVASIDAGANHTCAIMSAGGVKCWGYNAHGQLGDGTVTERTTPVDVVGLPSAVVSISAGDYHTCALTSAGGAKCWGYNGYGQLGDGTLDSRTSPVDVYWLSSAVAAIATGGNHTCALRTNGVVSCWGYNGYGQLGNGATTNRSKPVKVTGLVDGVTALALGSNHSCVITSVGSLQCWGRNESGTLGDGSATNRYTPVLVIGYWGDTDADSLGDQIDPDFDFDGDAVVNPNDNCLLANNTDQLNTDGDTQGDACDTDDDNDGVADAVDKFPLNLAVASDADDDGFPGAWNAACDAGCQASSGVVLDNCPNASNQQQQNTDADATGDACDTDDDNDSVADIVDNCVLVSNVNQLNSDGDDMGDACDAVPAAFNAPLQVDAGGNHTCALTNAGGVKCWGDNGFGQLGDGTTTQRTTSVDVVSLQSGVAAVAAGYEHTCALMSVGGVKCWGKNNYRQLGDGTTTQRSTPVDVSGLTSGVVAIAIGSSYTCVLTSAGGVKCWGYNSYGQLGDGTTTNRATPVDVVGLQSSVVSIVAGGSHSCALTIAGGVKCWGDNYYRQLGDGTYTDRTTPVNVASLTSGVSSITAGDNHACALTSAGGVKCWGDNYFGQLGDSTNNQRTTPVDVVGLSSGVVTMAAGAFHNCALTSMGGVKCWGFNYNGQLGDNTTTNRFMPVDVSGVPSGISAVVAGGQHSCVLLSAGGVKCWGYNNKGQSGDGTTTNRSTPVFVNGYWGDADADGLGDQIDSDFDFDSDGQNNATDNCNLISNADQLNTDGDTQGNACDTDDDNDGVADASDRFPLNPAVSLDTDSDGFADAWSAACDAGCQAGSGLLLDNCPYNSNSNQYNTDGDSQGDACDADDDNDTLSDYSDNCPLIANLDQLSTDGDAQGDVCDADDDNDGIPDASDPSPLVPYLDSSWDSDGKVTTAVMAGADRIQAITQQADGKVVAAGSTQVAGVANFAVVRYMADGTLDTSFSADGKQSTAFGSGHDYAFAVLQQPDNKLVVTGFADIGGNDDVALARYLADGSLDTTFSGDGKLTLAIGSGHDYATAMVRQPDSKLVIAGYSSNGADMDVLLVRFHEDGTLDTSFDTDGIVTTAVGVGNDQANALIIQPDGKLVVAGSSFNGTTDDVLVVRYNSDGSLDTSFNSDGMFTISVGTGNDYAYALQRQGDGKLVIAGSANRDGNDDVLVLRLLANGNLDISFDASGTIFPEDPAIPDDGGEAAGGTSPGATEGYSTYSVEIINVDPPFDPNRDDGIVTTAVGAGGDVGRAVHVQPDGKIWVGGYSSNGSNDDFALVRYQSDGNLDATFRGNGRFTMPVGSGTDRAYAMQMQTDGRVLLAGVATMTDDDFAVMRLLVDGDGDGVADAADAFPLNAAEQFDTDSDGIGNNADADDDNDGTPDVSDAFPLNPAESVDTDSDGSGNNADLDDDGDGVPDYIDADALNAANASERVLPVNGSYRGSQVRDGVSVP